MSHIVWMVLGCVGALLLIFVLPLLGVGSGVTLFIVLIAMFACHLLMMLGHGHAHQHTGDKKGPRHG